jgi:flavodoxin
MIFFMTIAVRYQSRGGNTKTVAEAIAKTAGAVAGPITAPITEPIDILFVGGGVYAWDIDTALQAWLESLTPDKVKAVAAFSTAGGFNGAKRIAKIARTKGIAVVGELPMKVLARNHTWFVKNGRLMLSEKELAAAEAFVKKALRGGGA